MAYEQFNVQLDLDQFFPQHGTKSALARETGLDNATVGKFFNEAPLAFVLALTVRNDALRDHILANPPVLIQRKRKWPVPDVVHRWDRQFRSHAPGLQFPIQGGGNLTIGEAAAERKEPEAEAPPSIDHAYAAVEALATKLLRDLDVVRQSDEAKRVRIVELEAEVGNLRAELELAQRRYAQIPTALNIPALPTRAIDDAARLSPGLVEELKKLPKQSGHHVVQ